MAAVTKARILVSGRVQGVAFRAYTEKEARRLGLYGWVRNLGDGRVEISAAGPRDGVEGLITWCQGGSPFAAVKDVQVRWIDGVGEEVEGTGFEIRY
jgi:acylphosphatase